MVLNLYSRQHYFQTAIVMKTGCILVVVLGLAMFSQGAGLAFKN